MAWAQARPQLHKRQPECYMQVLLTGRVKEGTGQVIRVRDQLWEPFTGSLGGHGALGQWSERAYCGE